MGALVFFQTYTPCAFVEFTWHLPSPLGRNQQTAQRLPLHSWMQAQCASQPMTLSDARTAHGVIAILTSC